MHTKRRSVRATLSPALLLALAGCTARGGLNPPPQASNEQYPAIVENAFADTTTHPLSTFGLDVDTASYANVRDLLRRGQLPPADAVRVEEFVNAFPYAARPANGEDALAVASEVQPCPWAADHWLLRVAVRARAPVVEQAEAPLRLVFLIDVSGSMDEPDKLPLVKRSLGVLVDALRPQDHVAIVSYSDRAEFPLRHGSGAQKAAIREAIAGLVAGGGTNGDAGLRAACSLAREMPTDGEVRVVLVTDGDFNIGARGPEGLRQLLAEQRKERTRLTVLGCGRGNLKTTNLEAVARAGDGAYHYLDGIAMAQRLFRSRLQEQLMTVAREAKVQVEFHPRHVASWRLLGYEDRVLQAREFADAKADGGEIGPGQCVTALYELVPRAGAERDGVALRYASAGAPAVPEVHPDELLAVAFAWSPPAGGDQITRRHIVQVRDVAAAPASHDFLVASTAAAFALLLRQSAHRGDLDWARLTVLGDRLDGSVVDEHELIELINQAARLARGRS
jgi:Ca-activated chloride channel family protein